MNLDVRTRLVADIVSAYVARNAIPAADLTRLISSIHTSIGKAIDGDAPLSPESRPEPAVPIKQSVYPDYIICLEDGQKFRTLKRHLEKSFGMTPEAYRARWGLPSDYPMVAPAYSKTRSRLAKQQGLGVRAGTSALKGPARKKAV